MNQFPAIAMASRIELWDVERLIPYARNARTHSAAQVAQIAASIKEFGFTAPILVASDSGILAGHGRLLGARQLGMKQVPVVVLDHLTEIQRRAYILADNKLAENAGWDEALLEVELEALKADGFDLDITGFSEKELNEIFAAGDTQAGEDDTPAPPVNPVSNTGDLWLCGRHRVICGDSTQPTVVARLLGKRKPILMVTDPPYGIELDSEWRDRAGFNMKHRTEGHTETTISGDTRADWSEVFALVPSIQVAYVWHASVFTSEVLAGLIRIGFLYPQQIIWNKGRVVMTRTHYWYQHEPCWYVRKKNAPWYGKPGASNSTIWDSASPKFIMGGSHEEKFDHPTQKPVELMRHSILNHLKRGEIVFEPFLGSGTTLAAAEITERVCCGIELDPKYVDVVVQRWQKLSGKEATLDGEGRTFTQVGRDKFGEQLGAQDAIKEEVIST